jgi:hypothetical protein
MSDKFVNELVSAQDRGSARDIMVDLETVDNKPTSAIASIGACVFDKDKIYDRFYIIVDHKTGVDAGLTASQDTLSWWAKQSAEARSIFDPETVKVSTADALLAYASWFKATFAQYMWGYGADFDNAILANAYGVFNLKQPWKHGDSRCLRTIMDGQYLTKRKGVYHNALDDAITQAQNVIDRGLMPPR